MLHNCETLKLENTPSNKFKTFVVVLSGNQDTRMIVVKTELEPSHVDIVLVFCTPIIFEHIE